MTGRQKKKLISVVVGLAIVVASNYVASHQKTQSGSLQPETVVSAGQYRVMEVVDGDTITVLMDGKNEKVRYIGVDTPETHKPNSPVQCFGEAASAFNRELLGKNAVRLEADPTNSNRDRYDRLLRYVYLPDGRLVNKEIISQGYGFAYVSFPFTKLEEFRAAEVEARDNNRGLWASCDTKTISGGREQTNDEN
jgi:micrococcal nuclease